MVEISIITDSSNLNEDDLISLSSEHWFNDNIINYYFKLIEANVPKRIKSFSTFFYTKLKEGGLDGILNWTWVRNLIDKHYSLYLIPIHLVNHWVLVVGHLESRRFLFYDPLGITSNFYSCLPSLNYIRIRTPDFPHPPKIWFEGNYFDRS